MKTHGEVHTWINVFLTSVLVGGKYLASCFGRFTSGTHSLQGWVGPRAGLVGVEEKFIDPTEITAVVDP
jgi:hypothetical protein